MLIFLYQLVDLHEKPFIPDHLIHVYRSKRLSYITQNSFGKQAWTILCNYWGLCLGETDLKSYLKFTSYPACQTHFLTFYFFFPRSFPLLMNVHTQFSGHLLKTLISVTFLKNHGKKAEAIFGTEILPSFFLSKTGTFPLS